MMKHFLLQVIFLCVGSVAFAQTVTKSAQMYPLAPTGAACCTLTTGGTAQNFQNVTSNNGSGTVGSPMRCYIVNPTTTAEQGVTAEAIWVNVLGVAVGTAGGGTSVPLEPGQSITIDPTTNAISWIAATTGHKISGFCWQ